MLAAGATEAEIEVSAADVVVVVALNFRLAPSNSVIDARWVMTWLVTTLVDSDSEACMLAALRLTVLCLAVAVAVCVVVRLARTVLAVLEVYAFEDQLYEGGGKGEGWRRITKKKTCERTEFL